MAEDHPDADSGLDRALAGAGQRGASLEEQRAFGAFASKLFGAADEPVRIGGRYVLGPLLGAGGMGAVYRAYDPELARDVAIKVLRPVDPDAVIDPEALLAEARVIATLSHPNVVEVYDVGLHEANVFVVMELVSGGDLRDWLDSSRSPGDIIACFVAAGRGLAAAHAAGVVHRDFKPGNVLLREDGSPKVTDFGAGPVMGTPRYMAPEQADGETVDARADQFAFCVALYEALETSHPFDPHEGEHSRRAAIDRGPREPTDAARPLWSALQRGLRVDPAERHVSMDALLRALPSRPPRRASIWFAVAITIAIGAGIVAAAWPRDETCADASTLQATVLDAAAMERVRTGLLTAVPEAGRVAFDSIEGPLTDYATRWSELRHGACAAIPVVPEHIHCLDRRRGALTTLLDVFERADAVAVERAVAAVRQLPALDGCLGEGADEDRMALPTDPVDRERVLALQMQIAAIKPLESAGQYAAAVELAHSALKEADAIGFPPSIAWASYRYGVAKGLIGDAQASREALERAAMLALEHGPDVLVAGAAAKLVGLDPDADAAERWKRQGLAAVRRGGLGADVEAKIWIEYGGAVYRRGEAEIALEAFSRALERYRSVLPEGDPELAVAHNNLGGALTAVGRGDEGLKHLEEALRIRRASLGDDHPLIATSLSNLAAVAVQAGELARARRFVDESDRVLRATVGPEHPRWLVALQVRALLHFETGEVDAALAVLDRAKPIAAKVSEIEQARLWLLRADFLRQAGRLPEALAVADEHVRTCGEDGDCRAPALASRAMVLADLGRPAEARAVAREAKAAGALDDTTRASLREALAESAQ